MALYTDYYLTLEVFNKNCIIFTITKIALSVYCHFLHNIVIIFDKQLGLFYGSARIYCVYGDTNAALTFYTYFSMLIGYYTSHSASSAFKYGEPDHIL